MARLLLANTAMMRGQAQRAAELLRLGVADLEPQGMESWSLAGRHALGRVLGGEMGTALTNEADEVLRARGVKHPLRFVGMMLPAFSEE
jgi:hypothetical protein